MQTHIHYRHLKYMQSNKRVIMQLQQVETCALKSVGKDVFILTLFSHMLVITIKLCDLFQDNPKESETMSMGNH